MSDLFLQCLIDIEQWDAADWLGLAFFHDPDGVEAPVLGFLFGNLEAGRRIFADWRERLGAIDQYEELRISIIKGEILGLESGYSLHVSSNPFHTAERAAREGYTLDVKVAVILSRIKRLTPSPESGHLAQFEKDFAQHRRYQILPVSADLDAQFDLAIEKRELHLRQADDIDAHDLDVAVFPEHYFDNDSQVN